MSRHDLTHDDLSLAMYYDKTLLLIAVAVAVADAVAVARTKTVAHLTLICRQQCWLAILDQIVIF